MTKNQKLRHYVTLFIILPLSAFIGFGSLFILADTAYQAWQGVTYAIIMIKLMGSIAVASILLAALIWSVAKATSAIAE
jgi:hypothetical protein